MNEPSNSQLIIYQTEDGRIKLDVRFEGETVWLTQQHMAELFDTTQQNVSLHLQNIYAEGELTVAATHKKFLSVRQEGTRIPMNEIDRCHPKTDRGAGMCRRDAAGFVFGNRFRGLAALDHGYSRFGRYAAKTCRRAAQPE